MRASLAALGLCVAVAACGDDDHCGAGASGPAVAMLLAAAGESFAFGEFTSSPNNDCPSCDPRTESCAVSVTIGGKQAVTGFPITFCLPRPDQIGAGPISLADETMVRVEDVSAQGATCSYRRDSSMPATGTLTFAGFCTTAGQGYTLTMDGSVPGTRTCPTDGGVSEEPVTLALDGAVQVTVCPHPACD